MHIKTLFALALAAPLLVACDGNQPPAKPAATAEAPAATKPAATKPVAQPASSALPADAQALLGTWASDLSQCGDAGALTVITDANYQAKGKSCDISLAAGENGSFTTQCGSDKLTLTPVFAPTGEGVNVVVGGGKRQTVFRCGR